MRFTAQDNKSITPTGCGGQVVFVAVFRDHVSVPLVSKRPALASGFALPSDLRRLHVVQSAHVPLYKIYLENRLYLSFKINVSLTVALCINVPGPTPMYCCPLQYPTLC